MQFEKVSFEQFTADAKMYGYPVETASLQEAYQTLAMPQRATGGSAGYDLSLPFDLCLEPGSSRSIPTGMRVRMPEQVVLLIVPRSGLGSRYRLQLANTIGVIDPDYIHAENEGHIIVRLSNDSYEGKRLKLRAGERFCQGLFLPFLVCEGDVSKARRRGGHGSTG